jgi:glycosyltransferase involved in cell wall biosynthesis
MIKRGGITVSYFGVHQAFQLALAAQELAALDAFYCSLFDAPGKWGSVLGKLFGRAWLLNRQCPGLNPQAVIEIPGPIIYERVREKLLQSNGVPGWFRTTCDFDHEVASRLKKSDSRIFVGTETCARDSFRVADKKGMKKILDCPQVHPDFLTKLLAEAADNLGLPPPPPFDTPEIAARKVEEFASADILLMISELERLSFVEAGIPEERLVVIPWGIDTNLWIPPKEQKSVQHNAALRVLFVGTIGFRKGIPYLMQALEKCGPLVSLTLVGPNSKETDRFLHNARTVVNYVGTKTKVALRDIYWTSDVLVLPSLVDTYGLVALEAMACGLPVIVTENCGVPVPDPAWRVPVMNSGAITKRLKYYATDREALELDGQTAQKFARQFGPERYQERIRQLFLGLL